MNFCYWCARRIEHIWHDDGTPVNGAVLPTAPEPDSRGNRKPPVLVEPVTTKKGNT